MIYRFSVIWSNDTHVASWTALCGNRLPLMTRLQSAQKSVKLSPFSFITPQPMFDHNLLVTSVISSYFGVEVTEYHYKIFFLRFVDLTLCLVGNE